MNNGMNNGKATTTIKNFTDLNAWKEGHELVLKIYKVTKEFPRDELFGLINQMRRCAVSITSNIAEGFSRQSFKEKIRFYSISLGSVTELQSQLMVARDINYISWEGFDLLDKRLEIVHKLVNGLIKSSKNRVHNS